MRVKQSKAKQSKAKQNDAMQCNAKQTERAVCSALLTHTTEREREAEKDIEQGGSVQPRIK